MREPTTLGFGGHLFQNCTNPRCEGCFLCHGGLSLCSVCGGLEGGLTKECIGRKLSSQEIDVVYDTYMKLQKWEPPTLEECGLVK